LDVPSLQIKKQWNLQNYLGYLSTWSGLCTYIKETSDNPLQQQFDAFVKAWGGPKQSREVRWPIVMLAANVL